MTSDELVVKLTDLMGIDDEEDVQEYIYSTVESMDLKYPDLRDLMMDLAMVLQGIGNPMTNAEVCVHSPRWNVTWGKTKYKFNDK